jgi:hypothetical protein
MSADDTPEGRSEPGFEIDEKHYPLPSLEDITLDEERILYIYSDTVLSDFMPAHPESEENERRAIELRQGIKLRNPDFKRALAHIAYRREHPDEADSDIQKAIGQVNALTVDIALLRGDGSPPATTSQKQPESESDSSEPSTPSDSGRTTESDSDPAAATPPATGTTESGTSSPPSLVAISGS